MPVSQFLKRKFCPNSPLVAAAEKARLAVVAAVAVEVASPETVAVVVVAVAFLEKVVVAAAAEVAIPAEEDFLEVVTEVPAAAGTNAENRAALETTEEALAVAVVTNAVTTAEEIMDTNAETVVV